MQTDDPKASGKQFPQNSYNFHPRRGRKWPVLAMAVLGAALAGCDMQKLESPTAQADRDVEDILDVSRQKMELGTRAATADSIKSLNQAASVADASNADKAMAKSMLADAEFDDATYRLLEVDQQELAIGRLLWEIGQVGSQVHRMSDTVKTLRATNDPSVDPAKGAIDAIDAQHKEIEDKQAAVKAQIDQLTAEVAKRQQEIDALKSDQTKTAESAESLAEQSSRINTQEGVDTFTKATEARAQAGTLAAKADAATAQLIPFQRDLALAQGQQAVWDASLKELDDNKKTLQDQWTKLNEEQITPQEQAAQALAKSLSEAPTGEPGAATPPKSTIESYDELVKSAQADRTAAAKVLEDAIKHYGEAGDAAQKLAKEMSAKINDDHSSNAPSRVAWKALQQLLNQVAYRAQQGAAQNALGGLYTGEAQELRSRAQVAGIIEPALMAVNVEVPAPLGPEDLQGRLEQAQKSGKEALEGAGKTVDPVANAPGATPELKHDAALTKAISLFQLYQLTQDGNYLSEAKTAAGEGIQLPPGPLSAADMDRRPAPPPEEPPAAPAAPAAPSATPADAPAPGAPAPGPAAPAPAPAPPAQTDQPTPGAAPAAPAPAPAAPAPAPAAPAPPATPGQ